MEIPVVEINHLDFSYADVPVLENVDLTISTAEFFGIIGPNAAGKSSLLKILLGLLKPDRGSVRVFGELPEKARHRIGYVPQHPTFRRDFPITVAEVVRLGQLGSRCDASESLSRFDAAIEAVQIGDLSSRQIATLSGGQLQRVMIARALACQPELLILDEPTSNIDIRTEENIFGLLRQYSKRMTIVVVSHDIGFISGYVDRVGCLNRTLVCHNTGDVTGRIIEELYGSAVKLIDHRHTT